MKVVVSTLCGQWSSDRAFINISWQLRLMIFCLHPKISGFESFIFSKRTKIGLKWYKTSLIKLKNLNSVNWSTYSYLQLCWVTFSYVLLRSVMICYVQLCSVTFSYLQLLSITSSYVQLRSVMFSYVQLRSITLSYIQLCSVTLSYV